MTELNDIRKITANFDIRAEALAVNLLKNAQEQNDSLTIDQLLFNPLGDRKRRISRDVEQIKNKYFDQDTVVQINVNRKGLFDTLPLHLFLRTNVSPNDPKKRTREIEAQISESRKFFLPFEQAAYLVQTEIEQLEQRYTERFPEFFERIWGLQHFDEYLNPRQKNFLCHLLPEAHRAVGNWELTGLIFEAVLQKPVDLNFSAPQTLQVPKKETNSKETILGEDAIMGDSFRDEFPTLDIIIKGISNSELEDYLPEGKNRVLIDELLCGYFIPIDVPYQIKIEVTTESRGFEMGEMTLGYNMLLA